MHPSSETPSQPTVLVTGANRGLGLGFVKHYLAENRRVIATTRRMDMAGDLRDLADDRLSIEELDAGNEDSIAKLAERLKSRGVRLDLLINNAGINVEESFGVWTMAAFQDCLRVNVTGPALLSQALAPLLRDGAKIINLSSGMGSMALNINPDAPMDSYAVSKAALNMLTHRLAAKLSDRRITVVAMSPGWVRTDMGGGAAPASVDEAIRQLTASIEALRPDQSGAFLSVDGEVQPW